MFEPGASAPGSNTASYTLTLHVPAAKPQYTSGKTSVCSAAESLETVRVTVIITTAKPNYTSGKT